jgi:hypothetical protein
VLGPQVPLKEQLELDKVYIINAWTIQWCAAFM